MKKLLIVVDYQNDFVSGSLGFEGAVKIRGAIKAKIEKYLKSDTVIYTLDTHGGDYLACREGKSLPIAHCIKGSSGHGLDDEIAPLLSGCMGIEKTTFGSSELLKFLQQNPFDEIELCGVVTDICVISNAVIAQSALPEAKITVDRSCVASADSEAEAAAFKVMKSLQIEVL